MKEYFLNLMKPCCNLSYLEMREFINAVEFNNEENRQEVLQGVTQKGTLTQEAWMLFIGSVPLNDTINLELLQEWSGQECKLSCEQWQRVIGGVYFDEFNFRVRLYNNSVQIKRAPASLIEWLDIETADDFKLYLELGVDNGGNYLNPSIQNIVITDFSIINDGDNITLRCNLFADCEEINFYDQFYKIYRIGEISGLIALGVRNSNFDLSEIKTDLSSIEKMYFSYTLENGFNPSQELPNLSNLTIDYGYLLDFKPTKNLPNLHQLEITRTQSMEKFNPTNKMPALERLILIENYALVDLNAINWTWFIPDNGYAQIHHNGVSIEGSQLLQRLEHKNWDVQY